MIASDRDLVSAGCSRRSRSLLAWSVVGLCAGISLRFANADEPSARDSTICTPGLPSVFAENSGQWPSSASFVARGSHQSITVTHDGFLARDLGGATLGVTFEGSQTRAVGLRASPARVNEFLGSDPTAWRSALRTFESVAIEGLANGARVVLHTSRSGLEYDLELPPGAPLSAVVAHAHGGNLSLDDAGRLVVTTPTASARFSIPATFAISPTGQRRELAAHFVLLGDDRFGFESEGRNDDEALVVDPTLVYSSFLGGPQFEEVRAIAVDGSCSTITAGWTISPAFPSTIGSLDTSFNGGRDAFVAKLTDSGSSLVFATFLGGGNDDEATAIVADNFGSLALAGQTRSPNFPTTGGAFDTTYNGDEDGFVVQLDSSGSILDFGSYLGSTGEDVPSGVAFADDGSVIVAGTTDSQSFPVQAGAFDLTPNGGRDAFLVRFSASGSALTYSTYLGGAQDDVAYGLAVQSIGPAIDNAFLAGATTSPDFPITGGAFDAVPNGGEDAFVVRLSTTGIPLYSTFLGGATEDAASCIAVDETGSAIVAGETWSQNFPSTPGAAQVTHAGGIADAFVTRLNLTGTALQYSTFLGGSDFDYARAVALDSHGEARIGGVTSSIDFPVTPGAIQASYGGGSTDGFMARLSAVGDSFQSATYFGGNLPDAIGSIRVDCVGDTIAGGSSYSGNIPLTFGAFDTSYNGQLDGFVVKSKKETTTCGLPATSSNYGAGKPGTLGIPTLTTLVLPKVPTKSFAIEIGNGLPGALPVLFLGPAPLALPFDGGSLLAYPAFILFLLPFNGLGKSIGVGPICDVPLYCGATVYLQAMFQDPGATGFYHTAQTPGLTFTLGN